MFRRHVRRIFALNLSQHVRTRTKRFLCDRTQSAAVLRRLSMTDQAVRLPRSRPPPGCSSVITHYILSIVGHQLR